VLLSIYYVRDCAHSRHARRLFDGKLPYHHGSWQSEYVLCLITKPGLSYGSCVPRHLAIQHLMYTITSNY
jgi:hypothetical protein